MPKYDAVVIGAGNGGLAAACRMAYAGKKTLLIERHNLPGGCASSFRRGRFEFETALHEICEWGTAENPGGCRKTVVDTFGTEGDGTTNGTDAWHHGPGGDATRGTGL